MDGKTVAVDGVLSIGEHGKYPTNERGQILYPRRRFFEEICKTFNRCKCSVPVFSDKHLATSWTDAKWMYDRSRELFVPFLAGSSLPVTWRKPPYTLPKDAEIEEVVAIGYGPYEGYGFHMLEAMECLIERRKGGEVGVKSVEVKTGEGMWKAMDEGRWSKQILEAGIGLVPAKARGDYRELCRKDASAGVFLIEYRDGLKASAAMLNGLAYEGYSGAFCVALKLKGKATTEGTHFYLQNVFPYSHFAYQLRAIEATIRTNHAAYPVERTLLTTGILEAGMISRHEGRKVETPYLDVKYTATDWPYAPEPAPVEEPKKPKH
jgi:hypothetical protein